MLFVHGILGTKANWRGIARRFVAGRPGWGAILIDLREHGESLGLAAPHTLAAAANDVAELDRALELPVGGALGHSFGGKVVLQWLRGRGGQPTEAWVIDASPSARAPDDDATETAGVLNTLNALPRDWPSRDAFVSAVTRAGQPAGIAEWLAMNLVRTEDGGREFGPDLETIRALLEDYAKTDLWTVVESPPLPTTLDVVIGERSTAFSAADRSRIEEIARRNPRVSSHLVAGAGHWVHVEAPGALVARLTSAKRPAG
jgi:pimeloyl-ACP methyl ester carboxylesterase